MMVTSHLRLAIRILIKQKTYSLVNLLGLSIAIACCVVVFVYVRNEYFVGRNIPDSGRIFRIGSMWGQTDMGIPETTLAPVGPTIADAYPEVEAQVRLYLISETVHVDQKNFSEDVIVADSSFLSVFNLPLVSRNSRNPLSEPRSVIIVDSLAAKMFGTTDVIGRTIRFDVWGGGERQYTITAVRKTIAWNPITDFHGGNYNLIVPFNAEGDFISTAGITSWDSRFLMTFVKLLPGSPSKELRKKLDGFVDIFAPAIYRGQLALKLEPLEDIYLDEGDGGARRMCSILTAVAAVILLIACINFMNLTLARSMPRSREVAVRRTLGAHRSQIFVQLLTESLIVAFGSALLALPLSEMGLAHFLHLFGRPLVLERCWDGQTLTFAAAVAPFVGVLAGAYPAAVLASLHPTDGLKRVVNVRRFAARFRSALVILQFSMAVILSVFVIMIERQLSFLSRHELGFDGNNVLVVDSVPREWNSAGVAKMTMVGDRLRKISGVSSVSLSFDTPTYTVANTVSLHSEAQSARQSMSIPQYIVDDAFVETYGVTVKEGRFFSSAHPTDSSAIVINETAASILGFDSPVGARVIGPAGEPFRVIGVLRDFHFESLHTPIRPLVLFWVNRAQTYRDLSLKLSSVNQSATISRIRATWHELLPDAPFDYFFVNQRIDGFYADARQLRDLIGLATGLALFISSMGIYGLAFLNVAQRVKEIGVRKVLGASIGNILVLLVKETVLWVVIANAIAWPMAYYVAWSWLSGFAYQTTISLWVFIASGFFALVVAFVTISAHAIRAAAANPVDALRYE